MRTYDHTAWTTCAKCGTRFYGVRANAAGVNKAIAEYCYSCIISRFKKRAKTTLRKRYHRRR